MVVYFFRHEKLETTSGAVKETDFKWAANDAWASQVIEKRENFIGM